MFDYFHFLIKHIIIFIGHTDGPIDEFVINGRVEITNVNLDKYTLLLIGYTLRPVYTYIYYHHHVVPPARISLTISRHFCLSFIASGRSSGLHPVSSHSCWIYVRAGRPAFAWPYVGVHSRTSLMSSPLLLQQCPACLVRLTWIVFVMEIRPDQENETQFLPGSRRIDTAVWMHYLDAN